METAPETADDQEQKPVYERRAVAFIDILGFSDLIMSRGAEMEIVGLFDELRIRASQVERASLAGSMQLSVFSDSIVVSDEILDGFGADRIAGYAAFLALDLLARGFLVRGGITVGDLHHRNGTVFGPALIEAYHLESKVAQYPRLVVSPEFRLSVFKGIGGPRRGLNPAVDVMRAQALFRTDFDGVEHVDIFGPFVPHSVKYLEGSGVYQAPQPGAGGVTLTPEILGQAARNAVAVTRKLRFKDPAKKKYDWMDRYLAESCARNGW